MITILRVLTTGLWYSYSISGLVVSPLGVKPISVVIDTTTLLLNNKYNLVNNKQTNKQIHIWNILFTNLQFFGFRQPTGYNQFCLCLVVKHLWFRYQAKVNNNNNNNKLFVYPRDNNNSLFHSKWTLLSAIQVIKIRTIQAIKPSAY